MTGIKRKADVEAAASRNVSQKIHAGDDTCCPPFDQQPETTPSKSYLDKLPSEILQGILQYSLEPCLIHTCRRLHQLLPSYTRYTRRLAGMAMIATPMDDEPYEIGYAFAHRDASDSDERSAVVATGRLREPTVIVANRLFALPGLTAPLNDVSRDRLERQVMQSKWFTLQHFRQTFLDILFNLTPEIIRCARYQLSCLQQNMIKKWAQGFVFDPDNWERDPRFSLRLSEAVTIEVRENQLYFDDVENEIYMRCWIIRMWHVPSCILNTTATSLERSVTRLVLAAGYASEYDNDCTLTYPTDPPAQLSCSRDLLQTALRQCIPPACSPEDCGRGYARLRDLLEISRACIDEDGEAVDHDMIGTAVELQHAACVKLLLGTARMGKDQGNEIIGTKEMGQLATTLLDDIAATRETSKSDIRALDLVRVLTDEIRYRQEVKETTIQDELMQSQFRRFVQLTKFTNNFRDTHPGDVSIEQEFEDHASISVGGGSYECSYQSGEWAWVHNPHVPTFTD